MSRISRLSGSLAAGAVALGGALVVCAPATAADVEHYPDHRAVAVELNHDETVLAAQVGVGNVIDSVLGNDNWSVALENDSKYQDDWYYRADKAQIWNNVTGQQVIAEAASRPNGTVTVGVYYDGEPMPLWVDQDW
ncbi:hypothetical protein [Williamsia sp.]|uniref:hypothetical protein n=1 Tax=Williamsia sp. TaxID=1872085 RepID=UPI002F93094E